MNRPIDTSLPVHVILWQKVIQIGASLEELITKDSVFDTSTYYEILAARNILKLLDRAYAVNESVKRFYDLKIHSVLSSIAADDLIEESNKLSTLSDLIQKATIEHSDTIKAIADFIFEHLEPITDLANHKNIICQKITNGTCEEKNILFAYELYFLLFPMFFSWKCSTPFSPLFLGEKYRKRRFWDGYDITPIDAIREYAQKKGRDH